jgi:hypothetical protein
MRVCQPSGHKQCPCSRASDSCGPCRPAAARLRQSPYQDGNRKGKCWQQQAIAPRCAVVVKEPWERSRVGAKIPEGKQRDETGE